MLQVIVKEGSYYTLDRLQNAELHRVRNAIDSLGKIFNTGRIGSEGSKATSDRERGCSTFRKAHIGRGTSENASDEAEKDSRDDSHAWVVFGDWKRMSFVMRY